MLFSAEKKSDGVIEEQLPNYKEKQGREKRIDSSNSRITTGSNGPHHSEQFTLKSNLKKATIVEENQPNTEGRKVTWSDAHGKDIAHVQEFEPSTASEDGELEGVRNSCVCAIQ